MYKHIVRLNTTSKTKYCFDNYRGDKGKRSKIFSCAEFAALAKAMFKMTRAMVPVYLNSHDCLD